MKNYTIAVAGTGYVGLSIATLLSQNHKVYAVDIVPEKVELINNRKSPIQDEYIEKYLAEKDLDLTATLDAKSAYKKADFVVIAAPTNYDSVTQNFNTAAVEDVIKLVMEVNPDATMVIKSTIPVGYTKSVREKFHCNNILFSPEFLRESKVAIFFSGLERSLKNSKYNLRQDECKAAAYALIDPNKAEEIEAKVGAEYLKTFPELEGKYSFHLCESADGVEL